MANANSQISSKQKINYSGAQLKKDKMVNEDKIDKMKEKQNMIILIHVLKH